MGFGQPCLADTVNITPEVWGQLMLAARDTERIEPGTGVTIPARARRGGDRVGGARVAGFEKRTRGVRYRTRRHRRSARSARDRCRSRSSSSTSTGCAICAARRSTATARRAVSSGTDANVGNVPLEIAATASASSSPPRGMRGSTSCRGRCRRGAPRALDRDREPRGAGASGCDPTRRCPRRVDQRGDPSRRRGYMRAAVRGGLSVFGRTSSA